MRIPREIESANHMASLPMRLFGQPMASIECLLAPRSLTSDFEDPIKRRGLELGYVEPRLPIVVRAVLQ